MAKIHIVGAGLSGMVAAINLAREGYEVMILEGHTGIGGLKNVHPSAHTTPIDVTAASKYTGIDLSPCFKPVLNFQMGVRKDLYTCGTDTLYCVERSNRPTSIDTYLYQDTVQMLIYRCLWFMAENNPEAEVLASSAKLFASEAAVKAADWTLQIMAQEGYCQGSEGERLLRDAKLLEILGDPTEKHRMYIADQVLAQY